MSNIISVHDSLQTYQYELTEPIGKNFDPEFKPDLTPREMMKLGVFGAHYFEGEHQEFPSSWFQDVKLSTTHDPDMNYFGLHASQSREEWERKGWISEHDPRGWFQWYCRYYFGRRIPMEDRRQIRRWKAITRHIGQIKAHCTPGDELCRRKQRQAVLHWAYDSRKL